MDGVYAGDYYAAVVIDEDFSRKMYRMFTDWTGQPAITYYENANLAISGGMAKPWGMGRIVIATGGTSDIPVSEEAALTAEFLGNEVVRLLRCRCLRYPPAYGP